MASMLSLVQLALGRVSWVAGRGGRRHICQRGPLPEMDCGPLVPVQVKVLRPAAAPDRPRHGDGRRHMGDDLFLTTSDAPTALWPWNPAWDAEVQSEANEARIRGQ